jgi:hypothetical protein
MNEDRDYDAGGLVGKAGVTREDQLEHPANFVSNGKLYLVRCVACSYSENGRARENWGPAVAAGVCAWCGWGSTPSELPAES